MTPAEIAAETVRKLAWELAPPEPYSGQDSDHYAYNVICVIGRMMKEMTAEEITAAAVGDWFEWHQMYDRYAYQTEWKSRRPGLAAKLLEQVMTAVTLAAEELEVAIKRRVAREAEEARLAAIEAMNRPPKGKHFADRLARRAAWTPA